jgi:hypothetical protein
MESKNMKYAALVAGAALFLTISDCTNTAFFSSKILQFYDG